MRIKRDFCNERGIATTEFIIVNLVFVIFLAGFMLIGNTILAKMKSLILVRNIAFNQNDGLEEMNSIHHSDVIQASKTPSILLDRCLRPYFGVKKSRIISEAQTEVSTPFNDWIPHRIISDQYHLATDTWKAQSSLAIGVLVASCSD
ncbi:MAG: hypothetical protein HY200_00800 [Nitrospirae bacterium]|nr:hypothetical protein [Nitrospirota bacterium]MBI3593476.1 hypothetical protein [Nitrospirota bacterium]